MSKNEMTASGSVIRNGTRSDVLALKALWKECFEDEEAYINAFFDSFYERENIILAEENGALMGASFFLPGKLYQGIGWQEIRYVYALATYPEFRGRGIAGRLLSYAYGHYHAPLIAEPAEEGLIGGFYQPLGFNASFYLTRTKMELPACRRDSAERLFDRLGGAEEEPAADPAARQSYRPGGAVKDKSRLPQYGLQAAEVSADREAAEKNNGETMQYGLEAAAVNVQGRALAAESVETAQWLVEAVDAEKYCAVRDHFFHRPGYVSWPAGHVAFAIREHQKSGGNALLLTRAGREDILLYYREDRQIVVTETTLDREEVMEFFLPWISEPEAGLVVRDGCETGSGQLVGMIYGMPSVNGYLNLSLD